METDIPLTDLFECPSCGFRNSMVIRLRSNWRTTGKLINQGAMKFGCAARLRNLERNDCS